MQQCFAVNKVDLFWQERCQTKFTAHRGFRFFYRGIDPLNGILQVSRATFAISHYTFPIPLIDIHRVDRRQAIFIRAQRFHMGIHTFTRAEIVVAQGFTLPFSQRVHDFKRRVRQAFDFHLNGFFAARKVILSTIAQSAEDRGLHFNQAKLLFQLAREEGFYEADLLLFLDKLLFHCRIS
ncbi:hypothetical protein D3C78_1313500 [compost metagenome]